MESWETIKTWLLEADAFVLLTGAGMGVDSGLPDYRGTSGQWGKVHSETDKSVFEVVNPQNFSENPEYAWKFFVARMKEYETTTPHAGFQILLDWIERFELDYFALTSNIDAHLQKAGFEEDRIREVHGSLRHFQCENPKVSDKIWKNEIPVDELIEQVNRGEYPTCPFQGYLLGQMYTCFEIPLM
ncbi:MAG: SIR2 family NAD-dependent protein deacylase [Flammeovirgaceae bacterium]